MPDQNNKPFLRVLKLAYKLHKAGAEPAACVGFINLASTVRPVEKLPSAAAPVEVIVAEVFNHGDWETSPRALVTLNALKAQLGLEEVAA